MASATYNWTAAFVAFCNNHPLEEIAEVLGIPFDSLKRKADADRWAGMKSELPLAGNTPAVPSADPAALLAPADPFNQGREGAVSVPVPVQPLPLATRVQFQKLAENRSKNLAQAEKLRDYMEKLLTQMADNGLKVEQLYHNKGTVVRTTRNLSPADLVNIATFMRLYHEMTYRALGDNAASDKPGQDTPAGHGPTTPAIIINLPGAIAQPREKRMLEVARAAGAKIIDVPGIVAQVSETEPLSESQSPSDTGEAPPEPGPAE